MEKFFGFYATPLWLANNGTRFVCMYRIQLYGEEMLRLVDIPNQDIMTIGHLIAQLSPETFETHSSNSDN
jgi:hypothetical protein